MIREFFQMIEPYLHSHGYGAVGFILLFENMGIPLPGELVLVTAGVLAASGHLNIWLIAAIAIVACIVGDNLGYFLGRWLDRRFIHRLQGSFGISPLKIDRAKNLFLKWGPWAVFFGRFIALLRIFSGPLAGMFAMPWLTFLTYNCLGAITWVSVILTASFYFGKGVDTLLASVGLWGAIIGVLVAIALKWHLSYKLLQIDRE